jgi:hypothetical protein
MAINENKDRFGRMFPVRVKALVDTLRKIGNCSNKHKYEWDKGLVYDTWLEVAQYFTDCAKKYDIDFKVLVNGTEVRYTDRKTKRKTP